MKKLIIGGWLAAGLMFAGCGKADEALKDLDQMKTDACACKTADCATKIEAKFEDWSKKNADTKGTSSQAEKAGKLISDISDCLMKAQMGDMGSDTGDTGSGSASGSAPASGQ